MQSHGNSCGLPLQPPKLILPKQRLIGKPPEAADLRSTLWHPDVLKLDIHHIAPPWRIGQVAAIASARAESVTTEPVGASAR